MNYADSLAQQSVIPWHLRRLGKLDYFSRRIAQSLVRLYEAGGQGNIDAMLLDLESMARELR